MLKGAPHHTIKIVSGLRKRSQLLFEPKTSLFFDPKASMSPASEAPSAEVSACLTPQVRRVGRGRACGVSQSFARPLPFPGAPMQQSPEVPPVMHDDTEMIEALPGLQCDDSIGLQERKTELLDSCRKRIVTMLEADPRLKRAVDFFVMARAGGTPTPDEYVAVRDIIYLAGPKFNQDVDEIVTIMCDLDA